MVRLFCIIVLAMHWASGQAQPDTTVQQTIDRQVWRPFIRTYAVYDATGFNTLHAVDVVRGTPWGIRTGPEYFEHNLSQFARQQAGGASRSIAFTFEHRVHRDGIAYEVGLYRVVRTQNGETTAFYGQFHVVLKKNGDTWKIAQDWDSDTVNGEKITEADFLRLSAKQGIWE
ncbi:MAG: nuclear transport factor 2 family protein [Bacteroidetes bacterium]|nr:MAG: nuclear transport factor 2 family protein [Bacteroidota bacterium]